MMALVKNSFLWFWLGSIGTYLVLSTLSLVFKPYEVFPAYGLVGYTIVILLLLSAIGHSRQRWDFILSGLTLVIAGVVASMDIALSRDSIIEGLKSLDSEWARELFSNDATNANLVNILLILLNIFTSSLAANVLFYGLNRRNFR